MEYNNRGIKETGESYKTYGIRMIEIQRLEIELLEY